MVLVGTRDVSDKCSDFLENDFFFLHNKIILLNIYYEMLYEIK